jgi:hypothetical protein
MRLNEYEQNVFINCPFDDDYAPLFEAIVFAINDAPAKERTAASGLSAAAFL